MIFDLFIQILSQHELLSSNYSLNYITLKIKGKGNKYFFTPSPESSKFHDYPNNIFVNGKNIEVNNSYDFIQEENNVTLIWDNPIDNCENMFYSCTDIIEMDLSNFDASHVKNMTYMFANCEQLTFINLTNFNTSQVNYMNRMFENCIALTSINVSSFDTSNVKWMNHMFYKCSLLTSLNLSNFITSTTTDMEYFFSECSLLSYLDISNFDTSHVTSMFYMFSNCTSLISLNLSNFFIANAEDINNMFSGCVNLEYINLNNFDEANIDKYANMFNNVPINIVICINETITKQKIFPQIKDIKCHTIDCTYFWKLRQKKLINNNECIEYNDKDIIKDSIKNMKNDEKLSKEEEIEYYNNIIKATEMGFTENYNTSNLDNGIDEYITTEKMTLTFSTTENQRNNINNNMTTIDLKDCENLLRKDYNLSDNETLYIRKIDVVQDGMKTLKVEYDIYCKLFGENLIKLNLTSCSNSKILISIPFEKINEDENIYNSNSGYYNDICYTTASKDGTDITLNDRQTNFINEDKIACQEECAFSKYDSTTSKVICSCDVKESSQSITDMAIDKSKLLENFKNIKNLANINFLICYKKLFNKEGLKNNIGAHILEAIILFHLISIIIFYLFQFSLIKQEINDIFLGINKNIVTGEDKNRKNWNLKSRITEFEYTISFENKNILKTNAPKVLNKKISYKDNKKKKYKKRNQIKKNFNNNISNNKALNDINNNKFKKSHNNKITPNLIPNIDNGKKKKSFNTNLKIPNKITDEEINELPYILALQIDKRSYCKYYASLLKTKHNLIFTFNKIIIQE